MDQTPLNNFRENVFVQTVPGNCSDLGTEGYTNACKVFSLRSRRILRTDAVVLLPAPFTGERWTTLFEEFAKQFVLGQFPGLLSDLGTEGYTNS